MSFEISGKVIQIFPIEQKSERFKKREFVVEKSETTGERVFTDYVKFQATNDKCDILETLKVGDEVKVSFNIRGNKWEKGDGTISYFTNLDAWRVEAGGSGASSNAFSSGDSGPTAAPPESDNDYEDDLPF